MKVIRIEPNGTCPLPRCDIPMVKVTCATPDGERSFRTHDDGSFDGHPAWVASAEAASGAPLQTSSGRPR